MSVIEVKHLTKRYGKHLAVDDLSFSVEEGEIYGFLGPNGAGKSTTMNILTGCLAATSGEATINGFDIFEEPKEAKKCIGYLPEIPPVYGSRTVREYLQFVAEAKKVPAENIESEIQRTMGLTGTKEYENRLIRHLSKGYRQRVGIAEALIGDPKVIILDEPTVGLDPQQIVEIRELIASLKGGHTVILSSHILSEVQSVCEKVIIIDHGRIVALDTPENLEKTFRQSTSIHAVLECETERAREFVEAHFSGLPLKGIDVGTSESGSLLKFTLGDVDEKELARSLFFAAADERIAILSMETKRLSLEEVFLKLTGEKTAPAEMQQEKEFIPEEPEIPENGGEAR